MQTTPIPLTPPEAPLIQLENVHKIFKTSAGEYHALKGINLSFQRGDFAAIMGKSGSGKSTLLNMLTGIDHPTSGLVRVEDAQLHQMNEGQLAVWRGRAMGIVFQFFQLLPTLSILENILLAMDYASVYPQSEREERACALLRLLALEDMADKLPAALSGGQQQIAAIARALANDPPIVVADEPTGNLDSRTAETVLKIFADLAARGKTILIVTHDPTLAHRAARRILISDGELVNEYVVQALPVLTHPQMLQIGKLAVPRRYEHGATIARQGAMDEGLYVLCSGQVEILRQGRRRGEEPIGVLVPGTYFSHLEMLETEDCDIVCRAQGPVEMLCVAQGLFSQWLSQNTTAEAALRQAARQRSQQLCPASSPRSQLHSEVPQLDDQPQQPPARKPRSRFWRWR
ncbi:MAG: ATP-binding cassette domain-containing protein [Chloroflexota bacterium]